MKRKCPTCPSTSWISSHNEVKLPCKFVPYDTSVSWACIVIHRCLWWIWPFLGSWRQVRVTFDRKPAGTRMPLPPWPKVPAWPICTPTCVRFCTCTWCSLHIFVSARVFKVRVCTLVYDYAHNDHICICLLVFPQPEDFFLRTTWPWCCPHLYWNPFLSSRALACKVHTAWLFTTNDICNLILLPEKHLLPELHCEWVGSILEPTQRPWP